MHYLLPQPAYSLSRKLRPNPMPPPASVCVYVCVCVRVPGAFLGLWRIRGTAVGGSAMWGGAVCGRRLVNICNSKLATLFTMSNGFTADV